ncbi:hypothetical protein VTK73DRAFT_6154 [Phialemonium thermophilum]|uniref:Uncharacterized protein n=1 Tax=Phialemonium thermophilum TaxID=223376 RepID=A0ABR3V117_9PEZI
MVRSSAAGSTAGDPPTSPAAVSTPLHIPSSRPRHGSSTTSASASSQRDRDQDQRADAFHKIHTSAGRADVLTTFNDFAPPPPSLPSSEQRASTGDLVQQGLSGLYSRFKEAVGVAGRASAPHAEDEHDHKDGRRRRRRRRR